MKQTVNNAAQLLNSPFGGKGAKAYTVPAIEIILLDNEISLALASSPPEGPSEGNNINSKPDYFDNNPLKTNFA